MPVVYINETSIAPFPLLACFNPERFEFDDVWWCGLRSNQTYDTVSDGEDRKSVHMRNGSNKDRHARRRVIPLNHVVPKSPEGNVAF